MIFYINECEEKLGYSFKDKTLLRLCFTHSSYSHEHGGGKNNERLEFFGDSILGFVTAEYLIDKFPNVDEGKLTEYKQRLVSCEPLSKAIEKSGLDEFLMFGEGEKKNSPEHHKSARENLFEAIVAGIYLDGGLEEVKKFIKRTLFSKTSLTVSTAKKETENPKAIDYKGKLQEFVQKNKLGTLLYLVKQKSGPDHNPIFTMAVTLNDRELAFAKGSKKTEAEKAAAQKALEILEKERAMVKSKSQKQLAPKRKNNSSNLKRSKIK